MASALLVEPARSTATPSYMYGSVRMGWANDNGIADVKAGDSLLRTVSNFTDEKPPTTASRPH